MKRPRILVLLQYYLPGYKSGGPVRSIEGLVEHLGARYEMRVLAYDRDSGDGSPYSGITLGRWQRQGAADVAYVPKTRGRWGAMAQALREQTCDLLYLQSLFNPCFTLWPLLLRKLRLIPSRPVLLAPRGELAAGALGIKPGRKRAFLTAARALGLFNGVHWQASTEAEAAEIRASGLVRGGRVFVARNLRVIPTEPVPESPSGQQPGRLRLVFVSRIAPKKRLDGALKILKQVQAPVRFDIHGPIDRDKAHWEVCRRLTDSMPAHIEVHYHGPSTPNDIPGVFGGADAFLFPTLGENFGHVIAESLLAGCAVLTSNRTPWNGLEPAGCGVNLAPDDEGGFARAIERLAATSPAERKAMRVRARQFGIQELRIEESVEAHKRMFDAVLGKR